MPDNLPDLENLTNSIRSGGTTARAAVEFSVNAADRLNQKLNAFLEIDRTGALRRADEIDKNRKQVSTEKASSVLTGIPIALKDNICVRGLQTSCGSKKIGRASCR